MIESILLGLGGLAIGWAVRHFGGVNPVKPASPIDGLGDDVKTLLRVLAERRAAAKGQGELAELFEQLPSTMATPKK